MSITFYTAHLVCANTDMQSVASDHGHCVSVKSVTHRNRIMPLCYDNSFGIKSCVGRMRGCDVYVSVLILGKSLIISTNIKNVYEQSLVFLEICFAM